MNRWIVACAAVVFFFGLGSARSEAAVIQCFDSSAAGCNPIGLFTWDVDSFFLDDVFTITNLTDPVTGSSFEDVEITVDTVLTPLGSVAAASQTDTLGLLLAFSSLQADLSFNFQSVPFAVSRTGPGGTSIYAEITPAPEPSLILLLLSGAVGLALRGKRRT